jgi:glycosyltransferase involved in cell wall biosynthesis
VYSYVLYPLILLLLPPIAVAHRTTVSPLRRMSVIIAARNEAEKIQNKIQNTLNLEHHGFEREIIIASDASDDATDEMVGTFASSGVILSRSPKRLGKEHAQRVAISVSTGDVLVFTDAATILQPDALMILARCYEDQNIGAVSSVDKIYSDDGTVEGEGLYVRYEMWLRQLEGRFNTLVGLSGSFFSARRIVCMRWDIEVCSDFGVALNCASLGLKAISDPNVVGYYKNLKDPTREYNRKMRTVLRGMTGLVHRHEVLNFRKFGVFSFQVFSHKVMRWAVPWLTLICGILSAILAKNEGSLFYVLSLIAFLITLLSPLLVRNNPGIRSLSVLRFVAFFVESNAAIAHATIKLVLGHRIEAWEPSKR